jgi:thioester reductase-like protein
MTSIWHALQSWAHRAPDRRLFAWLGGDGAVVDDVSYGAFVQRTGAIARHLTEVLALPVGARVLLVYPPGLEMIAAFFACVRIGLVPVPVYPPTQAGFDAALKKMEFIAVDCGAAAVLTDRTYQWSMKLNHARHRVQQGVVGGVRALFSPRAAVLQLPWIATTDAGNDSDGVKERHSELCFLQYTSGSTSDPKGVMVTHAGLLANGEAVVDHLPVGVSWLPQYHDMGLIGYYLFFAIKGGTTYGFSPVDFIRRPALWLQAITRHQGTASSAPNFAYEYCLRPGKVSAEDEAGLDLRSLRFLMNAAEPVRAPVMRAFVERFAKRGLAPRASFVAYGLAEFTLAVTNYGQRTLRVDRGALQAGEARVVDVAHAAALPPVELVSCGRAVDGAAVAVVDVAGIDGIDGVDDNGAAGVGVRLPERTVGEVWVSGPSACAGYWGRPAQSAATFQARLAGDPHTAWLRTGDLGFVDGDELFLVGRRKDVIIVQGQNLFPQDIERALELHPDVRPGGVAVFGVDVDGAERVAAVVEVRAVDRVPPRRALQALVRQHVGCAVDVLTLVPPKTLPKTSSGKLRRSAARARQEAGDWPALPRRGVDVDAVDVDAADVDAVDVGAVDVGAVDALGALPPPLAALFRHHGLRGDEEASLADLGVDSVALVELAHALQGQLREAGHGDVVDAVDASVLQRLTVAALVASLSDVIRAHTDASPLVRLRFRQALARIDAEHRADEQALMRRDCRLNFDPLQLPRSPSPSSSPSSPTSRSTSKSTTSTVLFTGATGFFGPFLLASLLAHTDARVRVLVRAKDEAEGLRRVLAGLRTALGPERDDDVVRFAPRITPVLGDLSRVNLGLTTRTWQAIAEETDCIYHNGAWVNYLYDYSAMRDANVAGTNEIVRLALAHRPKVLNHISTTFVFGWSTKDVLFEADTCDRLDLLDFGYSQSKWVSEQVIFDAMKHGLSARVFRPALITPSLLGRGSHFDIAVRLLAFMVQHGLSTTAHNQVSFSPADVAAQNVVAVAQDPASLGHTLHVTRDTFASLGDVTTLLSAITGKTFVQLPLREFVPEVVARCRPGDILFPLLSFLVRSTDNITAMEFKRYDNANFRRFRDGSAIGAADPPLDDVVLGLLRFMRAQGLVDV